MEKLVRDKIPEIIENKTGKRPRMRIADEKEFENLLLEKLREETNEFISSSNKEELADILEVIHAILKAKGWSFDEIEKIRSEKFKERGGFEKRIVIDF